MSSLMGSASAKQSEHISLPSKFHASEFDLGRKVPFLLPELNNINKNFDIISKPTLCTFPFWVLSCPDSPKDFTDMAMKLVALSPYYKYTNLPWLTLNTSSMQVNGKIWFDLTQKCKRDIGVNMKYQNLQVPDLDMADNTDVFIQQLVEINDYLPESMAMPSETLQVINMLLLNAKLVDWSFLRLNSSDFLPYSVPVHVIESIIDSVLKNESITKKTEAAKAVIEKKLKGTKQSTYGYQFLDKMLGDLVEAFVQRDATEHYNGCIKCKELGLLIHYSPCLVSHGDPSVEDWAVLGMKCSLVLSSEDDEEKKNHITALIASLSTTGNKKDLVASSTSDFVEEKKKPRIMSDSDDGNTQHDNAVDSKATYVDPREEHLWPLMRSKTVTVNKRPYFLPSCLTLTIMPQDKRDLSAFLCAMTLLSCSFPGGSTFIFPEEKRRLTSFQVSVDSPLVKVASLGITSPLTCTIKDNVFHFMMNGDPITVTSFRSSASKSFTLFYKNLGSSAEQTYVFRSGTAASAATSTQVCTPGTLYSDIWRYVILMDHVSDDRKNLRRAYLIDVTDNNILAFDCTIWLKEFFNFLYVFGHLAQVEVFGVDCPVYITTFSNVTEEIKQFGKKSGSCWRFGAPYAVKE